MKIHAAILLLAASAAARADDDKALQRSDEIYTALFADALVKPDDKHNPPLDRSYGIDARFGYHAEHHWGYELRVFYSPLRVKYGVEPTGNRSGIGGDAIYRFGSILGLRPYLLAGVGIAYSDRLPGDDWVAPYVNAGVGLQTGTLVEIWQRPLRVRAEVRYAYEDYRDEYYGATRYDPSNYLDVHTFVGLELALYRHLPEPPPAQPEVVPPVEAPKP